MNGRLEYVTAWARELSNVGHNTVTGDYSSTTLTKAKHNEHNTSESEPNVNTWKKHHVKFRLNPCVKDILGWCLEL